MKKIYQSFLLFTALLISANAFSQSDTLFFLNFQTDPSAEMAIFPDPGTTDTMWVNFDEDAIAAEGGVPGTFFYDSDWILPDSGSLEDTNFVFVSRSWLVGFDTSNSNWLVSPAMQVVDANATLHWKSAPYQGPRYVDGYSVKIFTGSQDVLEQVPDVVFRAAEMTNILGAGGATIDLDSFEFSNGYIHADGYTLTDYFIHADSLATDIHTGILEPHSISLAAYAGQTIYVAWHHDSADDNWLEIDDLLLMGTKPVSGTNNSILADLRFVTYPNPVDNFLNVMFRLSEPADVVLEVYNQEGKMVAAKPTKKGVTGDFTEQFDLRNLASGTYNVALTVDNQRFVKTIVRK